ncbi:MAG: alpha/beta hydrolase [Myxococcota bacterium]
MKFVRFAAVVALAALFSARADARTVSFTTSDSIALSADHQGSGDRGVVLIHGNGDDRSGWGDLTAALGAQGMQAMAIDLRGHGASKGEADPLKMMADVNAAIAYLRGKGVKHVTLVGSKLGATLALAAAAKDPAVEAVVMISPNLTTNGVKVSSSLKGYGERPLLMIAGEDDTVSRKAIDLIDNEVPNATVQILESGGSGMALVNRAANLETTLIAWATGNQKAAAGDLSPEMKMGEAANLETTGTKLGERK